MALPNERLIDARLTEWGLVRDDDSPLAPATSKNRTILCRAGPKKRVLVKIADGPGNVGVLREGGILELLSRFADDRRSPLVLPKVFAFDRNLGLLAVEWLSPSETLHSYHRRTGKYGRSIARQLGRALAFLHRQSRENPEAFAVRDGFREESDLLECFLRMRPDFYARLSRAGIDFFCEVQADAAAVSGLQAISDYQEEGEQSCLLHGDLKQANVLKVTKSRLQALSFVDWELSFWGDPARDVGSIVADYALSWLAPEHENEAITKETLHQVSRALLVALLFTTARGVAPSADPRPIWIGLGGVALAFHGEDSLVARIREVISMPDGERRRLGEAAMRRVEQRYGWEAVTDAYEQLFQRMLAGAAHLG